MNRAFDRGRSCARSLILVVACSLALPLAAGEGDSEGEGNGSGEAAGEGGPSHQYREDRWSETRKRVEQDTQEWAEQIQEADRLRRESRR